MSADPHFPRRAAVLLGLALIFATAEGAVASTTRQGATPRHGLAPDSSAFARMWDEAFDLLRATHRAADIELSEDGPMPGPQPSSATLESAISSNLRINDPAGDDPSEVQSETSAASFGSKVICGFNDSKGFTSGTISSYAYSADGGASWTDGGDMPLQGLGSGEQLYGDPGLCVNRRGHFWYSCDYLQPGNISAIGVLRGDFSGAAPAWNPPVAVAPTVPDFLDKPGIACDPDSDFVYVAYTRYLGTGGNQVEFARSLDAGQTWGPPMVLQLFDPNNDVIGAYLMVDEQGGVNVFWEDHHGAPIGTGAHSKILHRRSTDHGATFGPSDTAAVVHPNWYTGPPGFNRRDGFYEFPSVAVDLSAGPNRGTLYLTWNESADALLSGVPQTSTPETEPNGTVAQANAINIPARVTGTIGASGDVDDFTFQGTAGQMVRLYVTPQDTLFPWVRLTNAPAADTFLVDSRNGPGAPAYGWVTLPSTGPYTIDMRARNTSLGAYTLDVETVTPRVGSVGRDHRDVAVTESRNHGLSWSPPRVVNDDPPFFDNCMPFVSVDTLGQAQIFWYDRRNDALRGGRADLYFSRSSDGGATWAPNIRLTDQATTWQVPARSAPNFGDYSGATSAGNLTLPFFADGRFATPDVFTAAVRSGFALACAGDTTLRRGDTLTVHYALTNLSAFPEIFRYDISDSMGLLAPAHDSLSLAPQGSGQVVYQRVLTTPLGSDVSDPLTLSGFYRSAAFAARSCRSTLFLKTTTTAVGVPDALQTRMAAPWPNPSAGDVHLGFSLARPGRVRIAVYDVAGRRVAALADGPRAAGSHGLTWDGRGPQRAALPSGVYVVRAELGGMEISQRIVLLR